MIVCPTCRKHIGCIEKNENEEIYSCDICQQVWMKIEGKILNSEEYYKYRVKSRRVE